MELGFMFIFLGRNPVFGVHGNFPHRLALLLRLLDSQTGQLEVFHDRLRTARAKSMQAAIMTRLSSLVHIWKNGNGLSIEVPRHVAVGRALRDCFMVFLFVPSWRLDGNAF